MAKKIRKTGEKNRKISRSKEKKVHLSENFWALLLLVLGIAILVSVSMRNIGFVGKVLRYVSLALFSRFSYAVAGMLIGISTYKLIYHKTFSFKNIHKIDVGVCILGMIIIFSALHSDQFLQEKNLGILKSIVADAQNKEGMGLIPYGLSFLLYKLIGKIGMIVFVVFTGIYLVLKYKKDMLLHLLEQGRKKHKEKREEAKKNKEQQADAFQIRGDYFKDAPSYDDFAKKETTLLKYTIQGELEDSKEVENTEREGFSIQNKSLEEIESMVEEAKKEVAKSHIKKEKEKIEKQTNTGKQVIENFHTKATLIDYHEKKSEGKIVEELEEEKLLKTPLEQTGGGSLFAMPQEEKKKVVRKYVRPTIELLNDYKKVYQDKKEKIRSAKALQETLLSFGVHAKVENISVGPTITRYELKPKIGTKVSKITNLTEDLALALAAKSIRIEAPVPGKSFVGVEVPNAIPQMVSFKEVLRTCMEKKDKYNIVFAMGKDISGDVMLSDITKMPHALIAGATGSGKSVCINTIICSILYNYSPEEVKMILIDPKVVELSIYNKIPHLIVPVVTDMKKTPQALAWAVHEMEKRYAKFAQTQAKDIHSYNQKMEEKMPRIIIVIDELADLMMVAPKEIEEAICRLAQKARACGIHLIIATQRPSVDVITGLIKANIPSRISFAVSSQTDSRTILDAGGAEKLLGKGDMLYSPIGMNKPIRIQGAFLTEEEVEKITEFIEKNNPVEDLEVRQEEVSKQIEEMVVVGEQEDVDALYHDVVEFTLQKEEISTSLIQRQFRIGYNRASRMVDEMEKNGIVGHSEGSKARKVMKEFSSK